MASQLAFVGLGSMGQAMTKNLVVKGNLDKPLILYNRTRARAEEHSSVIGHATVANSLEEVVEKAQIIWSCLENQEAVLKTYDEFLTSDVKGTLFLECSTIRPEVTDQIAKRVLNAGGEFVAMPVFGEPGLANAGLLICVPGGAASSVDRIRPYLTGVVGKAVVDLSGERPGKASLLKLIGNVLIMTTMETMAELSVFSEKTCLGMDNMRNLVAELFPRSPHLIYWDKMANGDYYQKKPMVKVSQARDLTSHVLELAKAHGTSLKSYQIAVDHLQTVEAHMGPSSDITGIYGAVRLESELPFENSEL